MLGGSAVLHLAKAPFTRTTSLHPAFANRQLLSRSALWPSIPNGEPQVPRQGQVFPFIPEGEHPIVPIMLGDALLAQKMSGLLFEKGIYATAFAYPVVPMNKARIRTQVSAGHTRQDLDFAVNAFVEIKSTLGF